MASEIADAFGRVAVDRRDSVAVFALEAGTRRTFGDLAAEAAAMRTAIAALDLPIAPCVVTAPGNVPAFVALFLAVLQLEGAVALFDAADRLDQIRATAEALGADALVVPAEIAARAGLSGSMLPGSLTLVPVPRSDHRRWTHDPRAGPVILKMTSGSSDAPRAVVAAERHLINDARHVIEGMGIGPTDVSLAAIPLAHSYGLGNLVMPLLMQGSPIALRHGFSPRRLGPDIKTTRATVMPGVPFMFEHLQRHGLAASLAGVRLMITAGAPIDPDTVAFFKRATGVKLHSFYGTSETGGISFDAREDVDGRGTVGRPLPGVQVELQEMSGRDGGRVFVRSDAVAGGYAGPDREAASAFVDGGFLTGDVARIEHGEIVLVGRVSRFINVAGRKVDPAEVERVLRQSADVLDACVFGMACDRRGEQVVACVRRAGRRPLSELRTFCAARLPAYKVPREIVDVEAMPRDARGKVSRGALAQLVAHARARGD